MKIILSKHSGFCFGVSNALKIADEVLKKNRSKNIYMLGEVVHNEEVVKKIKSQGVGLAKNIKKIPKNSLVILSAHGHSPSVYKDAKKTGLEIIDATCPMVKKVHVLGKMLAKDGYFVIIIGDAKHQEVKAIFEQVKSVSDNVKIIENIEQAKKLKAPLAGQKIGIISQTTKSLKNFGEIAGEISKNFNKVKIYNTICEATRFRQASAKDLAKKVDMMLIVGSSHSANTNRLTAICKEIVPTYQVNSKNELDKNWFKNKNAIGISAGASAPKWIIDEVIAQVRLL
ncbi:MAG: 4-hydroxy-3-methylbut-2-enyl diphosphate reductase [bacterium]